MFQARVDEFILWACVCVSTMQQAYVALAQHRRPDGGLSNLLSEAEWEYVGAEAGARKRLLSWSDDTEGRLRVCQRNFDQATWARVLGDSDISGLQVFDRLPSATMAGFTIQIPVGSLRSHTQSACTTMIGNRPASR
jgi:hypothetical protein